MVEQRDLSDLPPDRFGDVVAETLVEAWSGAVDVSPASPGGAVDAVVTAEGERRLVHVTQNGRVDAALVRDVVRLATKRRFDATTIVTPGRFTKEARAAASEAGVVLVDGEALTTMVEAAGVAIDVDDEPSAAALARQFAGRWPEALRDRAVELAATIDDVADFEHVVTQGSARVDLDFTPVGSREPVTRMRFTDTSLLVYVSRGETLTSVVRLTAFREVQPPFAGVVGDLEAQIRAAMEECEERGA